MKELVVLSGKGGAGKTSITACLAALAGDRILVDCDVDASNLPLIVPHTLQSQKPFVAASQAEISQDLCTACGECVELCRFDALRQDAGGLAEVIPYTCEGCALCEHICPTDAIRMVPVQSGVWYRSDTPQGPLFHGELAMGQGNSGKLVSLLRNEAHLWSRSHAIETIIVDGPPGIGCPVISSLTGASYALIVTEPSLSGLHDLTRVLELTKHFSIPTGVCVNKADLNMDITQEIAHTCDLADIEVLGHIPYSPTFTRAQYAGETVLESEDDELKQRITDVWSQVRVRL